MGWMDAHEYFVMEQVVNDRLDDAERFSLERAFHSEPADTVATPHGPATTCACSSLWSPRSSSPQHV